MHKLNKKVLGFLILLNFVFTFCPDKLIAGGKVQGSNEGATYWSPEWFGNDRIIYIKEVTYYKDLPFWLRDISESASVITGLDYQICTANLEGKDEKIIRTFSMRKGWPDTGEKWTDDFFKGKEGMDLRTLNYSSKANLIVVSGFSGNNTTQMIVLTVDGKKIWNLGLEGSNPKFSPDGKQILYFKHIKTFIKNKKGMVEKVTGNKSLWLVNADGTNNRKMVDNAANGIWHPNGEKIIFYREPEVCLFNLKNHKEEFLYESFAMPIDLSPSGTRFILGKTICDFSTRQSLHIKNVPNSARFSPDERKILGSPVEIDGIVAIVDIDGNNLKKVF